MSWFNPFDVVAVLQTGNPVHPYTIRLRDGAEYEVPEKIGLATLEAIKNQKVFIERIIVAFEALPDAIRYSG